VYVSVDTCTNFVVPRIVFTCKTDVILLNIKEDFFHNELASLPIGSYCEREYCRGENSHGDGFFVLCRKSRSIDGYPTLRYAFNAVRKRREKEKERQKL
jgi:hypothetical protein